MTHRLFFVLFLQFHRYIITSNGIQSPMRRCILWSRLMLLCAMIKRGVFRAGHQNSPEKNGLFHYLFLSSVLLLYVDVRVAKRGIKRLSFFFIDKTSFTHFSIRNTLNYPHLFAIVTRLAYVHTFSLSLKPFFVKNWFWSQIPFDELTSKLISFSYILMVTNPIFCTFRKQQATIQLGVIANIFTSVIIYVITIKLLETKDISHRFLVEAILHVHVC